jgi:hypothetical protein
MRSDRIISTIGTFTPQILKLSSEIIRSSAENTYQNRYTLTSTAKESFLELDSSLRSSILNSDNTLAAIKRAGKLEDFEAFRQGCPSFNANEFLDALSTFEEHTHDDLQNLFLSYFFSISPELAYIASYMTQTR